MAGIPRQRASQSKCEGALPPKTDGSGSGAARPGVAVPLAVALAVAVAEGVGDALAEGVGEGVRDAARVAGCPATDPRKGARGQPPSAPTWRHPLRRPSMPHTSIALQPPRVGA